MWTTDLILMLRYLINDVLEETYTDAELQRFIVTAAQIVNQESDFDNDYVIRHADLSISPDPVSENDEEFSNLVVLKASCIMDLADFNNLGDIIGVKIKAGTSEIQKMSKIDSYSALIADGPCSLYGKLLYDYQLGLLSPKYVILTPGRITRFNQNA